MIEVGFDRVLSREEVDRLGFEAQQAARPVIGALPLLDARISPEQAVFQTAPIRGDAIRLDALFASFSAWGSPFGSAVSAYLVCRIAEAITALRRVQRAAPIVDRAGVLIAGDGTVQLLSFGSPALDALLRPEGAPEVRRANGPDPRDDVRALSTLYCELLSGHAHGVKPLPDPRPRLIEVLKSALAAEVSLEAFSTAVARESAEAQSGGDPRAALARLIEDWADTELPRGDRAIEARYMAELERREAIGAPALPELFIPRSEPAPPPAPIQAEVDAWSQALGEAIEAPAPPPPPSLKLPPPAAAPSPAMVLAQLSPPAARPRGASIAKAPEKKSNALKIAAAALSIALVGGVWIAVHLQSTRLDGDLGSMEPDPPKRTETSRPTELPKPVEAIAQPQEPQPQPPPEKVSMLTVMSRPLGATVELDDGYVGKTPLVLKHPLNRNDYKITVMLDGYKKWSTQAYVDKVSGTLNVMAVLEAEPK